MNSLLRISVELLHCIIVILFQSAARGRSKYTLVSVCLLPLLFCFTFNFFPLSGENLLCSKLKHLMEPLFTILMRNYDEFFLQIIPDDLSLLAAGIFMFSLVLFVTINLCYGYSFRNDFRWFSFLDLIGWFMIFLLVILELLFIIRLLLIFIIIIATAATGSSSTHFPGSVTFDPAIV